MRLFDGLRAIRRGEASPVTTSNEMTVADRRVAEGLRFLDQEFGRGRWEHRISLKDLDIRYDRECIVGQLCGSYGDECKENGILFYEDPRALGFFPTEQVSSAALTVAWKRALKARQRDDFAREERGTSAQLQFA